MSSFRADSTIGKTTIRSVILTETDVYLKRTREITQEYNRLERRSEEEGGSISAPVVVLLAKAPVAVGVSVPPPFTVLAVLYFVLVLAPVLVV